MWKLTVSHLGDVEVLFKSKMAEQAAISRELPNRHAAFEYYD